FAGESEKYIDYSQSPTKQKHRRRKSHLVNTRKIRDVNILADITNSSPGDNGTNTGVYESSDALKGLLLTILQIVSVKETTPLPNNNLESSTVSHSSAMLNDLLMNLQQSLKDQENITKFLSSYPEIINSPLIESSESPERNVNENSKSLLDVIIKLIHMSQREAAAGRPGYSDGFTRSPLDTMAVKNGNQLTNTKVDLQSYFENLEKGSFPSEFKELKKENVREVPDGNNVL
ncbi:hypothetical protein NPIL_68061, partial [Nephila pilipes]